jgi:hypothetical protein
MEHEMHLERDGLVLENAVQKHSVAVFLKILLRRIVQTLNRARKVFGKSKESDIVRERRDEFGQVPFSMALRVE